MAFTVCYGSAVVALNTASGRFRFRVLDILKSRKQPQNTLAAPEKEGWLSNKMRGYRGLSLDEAAEIADALRYPLSELLSSPDSAIYELNSQEQLLIDAFRRFTDDERKAALTLLTLRQRAEPHQRGKRVAPKRPGAAHGGIASARGSAGDPAAQQQLIMERAERELSALHTRGQAPTPRPARPALPAGNRDADGSHTKKAR